MAIRFACDPDLAAASSSQLAGIKDQIDPVGQWLGDVGAVGVEQVAEALGEFGDAASSLTEDLATRVGTASELFGRLASGTQEVDESLAERLGLVPAEPAEPAGQSASPASNALDPPGGMPPGDGVVKKYPLDYTPSAHPPPTVNGPHASPESWANGVNLNKGDPGKDNNCGECARSVQVTWGGKPYAAAAMTDPGAPGEPPAGCRTGRRAATASVDVTGRGAPGEAWPGELGDHPHVLAPRRWPLFQRRQRRRGRKGSRRAER